MSQTGMPPDLLHTPHLTIALARQALMQHGFQRVTNLGSVAAAQTKAQGREN